MTASSSVVGGLTQTRPSLSPKRESSFKKQPVSPPQMVSDSEAFSSDGGVNQPRQVSLLSSMLSSHAMPRKTSAGANGYTSGGGPSGPSTPSTALSSPRLHEEPVSILRRASFGSEGEQFFLPLSKVVPKESDKAALEPKPLLTIHTDSVEANQSSHVSTVPAVKPPQQRALKFAVANRPTELERPIQLQADSDEEAVDDTDLGYEEDSEDGFSDDEPGFMYKAHKMMSLARATSDSRRPPRSLSTSPPSRVTPPPPPRRGRGHVRVDPAAGQDHTSCSRHYSPPPSDTRSTPPPGPRFGRAGSPLPSPIDVDDDEDEDENENDNDNDDDDEDEEMKVNGEQDKEHSSESDELDGVRKSGRPDSAPPSATVNSVGSGVRDMLRRASEHLPSFRRPSFTTPIPEDDTVVVDEDTTASDQSRVLLARARSLGTRTERDKIRTLSGSEQLLRSQPVACPARR